MGPDTWRSLYEAGYRLGDRLLFYRRPMIRGEDVSEIQSRLNSLGFDAGKVDRDIWTRHRKGCARVPNEPRFVAEDGKAGPEVVTELRLVTRGEMKAGRHALREQEWLRRLPNTLVGARVYLDAGCRNPTEARSAWVAASATALQLQQSGGLPILSRSEDVSLPERLRARRANRYGSDIIIAFQLSNDDEDRVLFFSSEHSRSAAGAMLASAIADCRWRNGRGPSERDAQGDPGTGGGGIKSEAGQRDRDNNRRRVASVSSPAPRS